MKINNEIITEEVNQSSLEKTSFDELVNNVKKKNDSRQLQYW